MLQANEKRNPVQKNAAQASRPNRIVSWVTVLLVTAKGGSMTLLARQHS
jgi:hypothetical protein